LAREASGNNKVIGDSPQVVEDSGALCVVASERANVVPYRQAGQPCRKHLLLVRHDFDGADWLDSVDNVRKDSAAAPGEQMKRVFWFIHIVVLSFVKNAGRVRPFADHARRHSN
jgi:hypothetical protein